MKFTKKKSIIILISLIAAVLFGSIVYFSVQSGPYDKNNKDDIIIDIPVGSTANDIANILKENKLIKDKLVFKLNLKIKGNANSLKSGKYLFNQTYSNSSIIDTIASGKIYNDGIKITIPEGSTSKEIVAILVKNEIGSKEEYEKLIKNPKEFYEEFVFLNEKDIKSLEGFLYPATYYFDEEATEKEVLSTMLKLFDDLYTDEMEKKVEESELTLQEVVNLASIVEKEAVLDEDRAIIASVFFNRMDVDMPLQSDATLQYAFETRKKSMTYKDLKIDSKYNTYKYKGLPPTPIASPCMKSIEAVLEPADTKYVYFVASIDGGNVYSETYDEHVKNVEKYRKDRDERNRLLEEAEEAEKAEQASKKETDKK